LFNELCAPRHFTLSVVKISSATTVFQLHLQQRARFGIHGGVPKAARRSFLEPLNRVMVKSSWRRPS
jgi:hypothetical protein